MHRYYVSFSFQSPSGLGVASLDVITTSRISKVEDLAPAVAQIAAQGYRNAKILAFSLYAQESNQPHRRPSPRGNRR